MNDGNQRSLFQNPDTAQVINSNPVTNHKAAGRPNKAKTVKELQRYALEGLSRQNGVTANSLCYYMSLWRLPGHATAYKRLKALMANGFVTRIRKEGESRYYITTRGIAYLEKTEKNNLKLDKSKK